MVQQLEIENMGSEKAVTVPSQKVEFRTRSRLETFCDILRALGSGAGTPSQLLYKTNLALPVLQSFTRTLESQGLVEGSQDGEGQRVYKLTDKGYKFLSSFLTLKNGVA